MVLCYATYARALQKVLTSEKSDEKITNLLLGFVIDTADIRDKNSEDEPYTISAKRANQWLNQEAELYSGIKTASGDPDVIEGAGEYFEEAVMDLINENRQLDLLSELSELIENDESISTATKDKLLQNADDIHLTTFLAETFLYALGKPNKLEPDGRRKDKKTSAESEQLVTVKNAISVLPKDAVNKLVQFLMSTVYAIEPSEQEHFRSFKDAEFHQAVQNLLHTGRMTYRELYKTNNFLEIAAMADEELHDDDGVFEPVDMDFDWFFRFFEAAGGISNEDMRKLWAKVLAGEIREQGSFSLRTMDVLRNMTAREAKVFQIASQLVLTETDGGQFLIADDTIGNFDLNERHGLANRDLYLLEECGLINGFCVRNILDVDGGAGGFILGDELILLVQSKKKDTTKFHYRVHLLSQAAIQLIPIVRDEVNCDYFIELGKIFKEEQGNEFQISVHDFVALNDDGGVELDYDHDYLTDD